MRFFYRLRPKVGTVQGAVAGSLLAGLAGQTALLVSGVVIARGLGPENRGYFALLTLLPVLLILVGDLGIPASLPYFIGIDRASARAIMRVVRKPASLQVVGLVIAHAAILGVLLPQRPLAVQLAGLITLAVVPSGLVLGYSLGLLQGQHRFRAFNTLRSLPAIGYAALAILLFFTRSVSLPAASLIWTGSYLAAAGLAAAAAARSLQGAANAATNSAPPTRKQMVRFGLKSLVGAVSPVEAFRVDQLLIGLLLAPAALGLYVVGLAFTNLPRLLAQSIGTVVYPYAASHRVDRQINRTLLLAVMASAGVTAVVVLALALGAGTLVAVFFGPKYAPAVPLIRVLLVGAFVLSVRRVLADSLRGLGMPEAGSIAEIASWLWLIVALFLTVGPPKLASDVIGVGVAFSSAASFGFLILVGIYIVSGRAGQPSRTDADRLIEMDASA